MTEYKNKGIKGKYILLSCQTFTFHIGIDQIWQHRERIDTMCATFSNVMHAYEL